MAKKPTPATPVDSEAMWRARNDADSLQRAGEIVADAARHKAAVAHMQKQMAGMQKMMSVAPAPKRSPSLGFAKKGK